MPLRALGLPLAYNHRAVDTLNLAGVARFM
jgi:hypothetical protein